MKINDNVCMATNAILTTINVLMLVYSIRQFKKQVSFENHARKERKNMYYAIENHNKRLKRLSEGTSVLPSVVVTANPSSTRLDGPKKR